ncbi:MAG: HAD family hydrolase [Rubrobacteraceae bacterium]
MRKPKALIFDLDGTISDTQAIHFANWMEVLRPHGIEVDIDLYEDKLGGPPSEADIDGDIDGLLPDLSEQEKKDFLKREADGYRKRMSMAGTITGLTDFLEEARKRGIRLALVSNAPKNDAGNSLGSLDMTKTFETLVFAEEVGAEKPDPSAYQYALKQLGIEPEALAFEDSPSGTGGAVAAGIPVVGLCGTNHTPSELREAGAEFIIGDYADQALYDRLDGQG